MVQGLGAFAAEGHQLHLAAIHGLSGSQVTITVLANRVGGASSQAEVYPARLSDERGAEIHPLVAVRIIENPEEVTDQNIADNLSSLLVGYKVALKQIGPQLVGASNPWLDAARAGTRSVLDGVLTHYGMYSDGDRLVTVMPWVSFTLDRLLTGWDLNGVVSASSPVDPEVWIGAGAGGVDLDRALRIANDLVRGVSYTMSKGIVHRDIAERNVLVAVDGHSFLTDFGVATTDGHLHQGTFGDNNWWRLPPEGAPALGERWEPDPVSAWQLGVVLCRLFTGQWPYHEIGTADKTGYEKRSALGWPPENIDSGLQEQLTALPSVVVDLIRNCLSPTPGDRPRSNDLLGYAQRLGRLAEIRATSVSFPAAYAGPAGEPLVAPKLTDVERWVWGVGRSRRPAHRTVSLVRPQASAPGAPGLAVRLNRVAGNYAELAILAVPVALVWVLGVLVRHLFEEGSLNSPPWWPARTELIAWMGTAVGIFAAGLILLSSVKDARRTRTRHYLVFGAVAAITGQMAAPAAARITEQLSIPVLPLRGWQWTFWTAPQWVAFTAAMVVLAGFLTAAGAVITRPPNGLVLKAGSAVLVVAAMVATATLLVTREKDFNEAESLHANLTCPTATYTFVPATDHACMPVSGAWTQIHPTDDAFAKEEGIQSFPGIPELILQAKSFDCMRAYVLVVTQSDVFPVRSLTPTIAVIGPDDQILKADAPELGRTEADQPRARFGNAVYRVASTSWYAATDAKASWVERYERDVVPAPVRSAPATVGGTAQPPATVESAAGTAATTSLATTPAPVAEVPEQNQLGSTEFVARIVHRGCPTSDDQRAAQQVFVAGLLGGVELAANGCLDVAALQPVGSQSPTATAARETLCIPAVPGLSQDLGQLGASEVTSGVVFTAGTDTSAELYVSVYIQGDNAGVIGKPVTKGDASLGDGWYKAQHTGSQSEIYKTFRLPSGESFEVWIFLWQPHQQISDPRSLVTAQTAIKQLQQEIGLR